jgi:hypothetical protein
MQKLPVYLYPNLLTVQLDLDNEVKGINNTMYQRELKLQKGLKNKVQIQFKNSDQKRVRIHALTTLAAAATTASSTLVVSDPSSISVGMWVINDYITTGTFVSAIANNILTLDNVNPEYDPFNDSFNGTITTPINSGTNVSFNHNFVFSMFNSNEQRMVLQKTLSIIDDGITTSTRGIALLELSVNDTRNLSSSYYTFGVTLTDNDGTNIPAYSNTYYGINGTVNLTHELWPTLKDSQTIIAFQRYANETTNQYEFYTGNLKAYPEHTQTTTAAMYLNNFTGTIKVQATLDNSPATFGNYVTLDTRTYTGFTGVDYANVEGIWNDVRVVWIPNSSNLYGLHNYYSPQMPGNPTPGSDYWPNGKIDKVLYRC